MGTAATSLPNSATGGARAFDRGLTPDVLRRRVGQRRQMLGVQAASYLLGVLVLLVYSFAGTVSIIIPSTYFLCGFTLMGFFVVLSEAHVSDRFEDHYLTIFQVAAHVALQLGFVLAAPTIGYAFLSVILLIFGFGALRMTARQATVAWTFTTLSLAPIFLFTSIPVGMRVETDIERVAAMLWIILTTGQCAFVGLYGSSLRRALLKRSIELKEAYKRIEELAELDELTGSFNRRCIMRLLDDEVARAHRSNSPCAVALIDLDWFKRVNDAYGHPTGDEVLRTFAITMFANIRGIDKFGRYGGEEFLLILPDTTDEAGEGILDRLREIIAALDWSAFSPGMSVTISAGVAMLSPNETPDTVLARADSALYAAKERGRNRIARA